MARAVLDRRRGFSLIELVMVIVLLGLLATISGALLKQPFDASQALQRRAQLADDADQAMSRLSRELRLALPNSVRVSADGQTIEWLSSLAAGRYRAQLDGAGAGDVLDFSAADSSFDVPGGLSLLPQAGQWAVVYNLSATAPVANAWLGDNRASISGGTASQIQLSPAFQFPFPSPQQRVYLVDVAVQYRCNGGQLLRHAGYAPAATLTAGPAGAQTSLLLDTLSACLFRYDAGAGSRHALVSVLLGLTRSGETASLQKSIHLPNAP